MEPEIILLVVTAVAAYVHGEEWKNDGPQIARKVRAVHYNIPVSRALTPGGDRITNNGDQVRENSSALKDEIKKEVMKVIGSLPTAFNQFSEVLENENLTAEQMEQKKMELMSGNPTVFHVLMFIFELMSEHAPNAPWYHGPHGPYGPHGPHGPYGPYFPYGPPDPPGPHGFEDYGNNRGMQHYNEFAE
ncbi:hypothetical protein GCK32_008845 [Trichostrongylus colubriformis]|uniref:SXP/RAL-2 family protein Ani s 5-like cation-binding domain-containing protein n=1 Tax=Trichostrongylus colubriformis TaxID=6319 RepID=A0AAN8EZT7_TRICO